MGILEDFAASVTGLASTLTDAAEGKGSVTDTTLRDQYIIARVNVAVAEAMARFAVTQAADKAAKIAEAAGHFLSDSEQRLEDSAVAAKTAVVQEVKDAYQKAIDLGVSAAKGVHDQVLQDAKSVGLAIEAQLALGVGAVLAYLWWKKSSRGPSTAEMRRAVLMGES